MPLSTSGRASCSRSTSVLGHGSLVQVQLPRSEMDTLPLLLIDSQLVQLHCRAVQSNGFGLKSCSEIRWSECVGFSVRSNGFRWRERVRVRCAGETSFQRSARLCRLFYWRSQNSQDNSQLPHLNIITSALTFQVHVRLWPINNILG